MKGESLKEQLMKQFYGQGKAKPKIEERNKKFQGKPKAQKEVQKKQILREAARPQVRQPKPTKSQGAVSVRKTKQSNPAPQMKKNVNAALKEGSEKPKPMSFVEIEEGKIPTVVRSVPVHYSLLDVPLDTRTELIYGSPEDPVDVYIGLDFGTSSIKAAVYVQDFGKIYAIPFTKAPDIQKYLMPTKLYKRQNGEFFVEVEDDAESQCITQIKTLLINDPKQIDNQVYAIAILSNALKRIRGWFLLRHENDIKNYPLSWRLIIGVPSITATKDEGEIWKKVASLAWMFSLKEELPKFDTIREKCLQKVECNIEVSAQPEISAIIYAITSNTKIDNDCPYAMVDAGASTVDACAFKFSKGRDDFKYTTTIMRAEVSPWGTMKCHEHRKQSWIEAVQNTVRNKKVDVLDKLVRDLKDYELTPEMNLPNSYKDYVIGAKVTGYTDIDNKPRSEVARLGRESVMAFDQRRIQVVHLYLTGGGSRCETYKEGIERTKENKSDYTERKESVKELKDLVFADSTNLGDDAWIRLSTAYGLAKAELGEVEIVLDEPLRELLDRPDFTDRLISKDMV